jgi:hypothetical protein
VEKCAYFKNTKASNMTKANRKKNMLGAVSLLSCQIVDQLSRVRMENNQKNELPKVPNRAGSALAYIDRPITANISRF